jgi:uncharacterized membrane protein
MLRSFLCALAALLSLAASGRAQAPDQAKPLNKPAIEEYVRNRYGLEKGVTVQVGDARPSAAGFREVIVSISLGTVRQDIPLLVSNSGSKILRSTSSAEVGDVHFWLNHFPTIGFLVGLGLYVAALATKSNDLKRASLVIFLGIALLSIPTYVTGNAAQEALCSTPPDSPCPEPAISRAIIQAHEGAALLAMAFMELTGALAWLGLWQFRRTLRVPGWNAAAILLIAMVTFGLMTRAADIGGEIRHPEVQSGPAATIGPPLARAVGTWVTDVPWIWPTCETLHFVGLSLLFGIALVVDLRMLGILRSVSFAALHRLMPWGILGFGLNLITGMLFFVGDPGQYTQNIAFQWKLALILLAGINVLYFTVFDAPWALKPGEDAPFTAKFAAASAIVLVVGVMYFGRMLPFLGNAF